MIIIILISTVCFHNERGEISVWYVKESTCWWKLIAYSIAYYTVCTTRLYVSPFFHLFSTFVVTRKYISWNIMRKNTNEKQITYTVVWSFILVGEKDRYDEACLSSLYGNACILYNRRTQRPELHTRLLRHSKRPSRTVTSQICPRE